MNPEVDDSLAKTLAALATPEEQVDALFEFMVRNGSSYYDESVTQLEHAIQAANLARQSNAEPALVVSALLHDIGHFLMNEKGDFQSEDWNHEEIGADQLRPFFAEVVIEPIRLHVPAKRYLCTVDSTYYEALSPASQRSFELQGGKLSPEDVKRFEANAHYSNAILLRRWDDGAKVIGYSAPSLKEFRADIIQCLREFA